jgi:hypothetical protein
MGIASPSPNGLEAADAWVCYAFLASSYGDGDGGYVSLAYEQIRWFLSRHHDVE